jgi:hypothetical protein
MYSDLQRYQQASDPLALGSLTEVSSMRCHYCRGTATLNRDHIVPRARAGVDEDFNIVFACYRCNTAKGDDWPTCDCSKCSAAIDNHWAMIEEIRQWSPKWADQLTWVAHNGRKQPPTGVEMAAAFRRRT